ncbi:Dehydrogenase [Alternaria alternata]|nr:Dehydrogenase [Alternaria alternata]
MIYQRGDRGSYQRWADQVGDDSYTFDNLMPYFKKSVKFTPPNTQLRASNGSAEYVASAFDASGGPLDVSYANYAGPFSSYMEGGLNGIGIPTRPDFNSGELMGAQYCSSTITPGNQKRASSQTAFLEAAKNRPNLKVYSLTRAEKIIFNSEKRATGVQLPFGSILTAKREVILSAGAFQSPQLLMVSGVGPAAQLKKFNIPIIADRRGVGQNMQDHIFFGPTYRYKVQTLTKLANDLLYVGAQFAFDYGLLKKGPLTNPVCDFLGWEKAPRNLITSEAAAVLDQYPPSWPDIEYLSAPGYIGDFSNLFATQPKDGYQYASILGAIVAPLSRGSVTITSSSTAQLPLIDPGWLTDPTDQSVAIAIYKRTRQAFATDAMKRGLADTNEYFPGPNVQTDEQILNTIRNTMGKVDDPDAVVDSKARVIGVTGLRVVDASSFALLPPGHPQALGHSYLMRCPLERQQVFHPEAMCIAQYSVRYLCNLSIENHNIGFLVKPRRTRTVRQCPSHTELLNTIGRRWEERISVHRSTLDNYSSCVKLVWLRFTPPVLIMTLAHRQEFAISQSQTQRCKLTANTSRQPLWRR